MRLGQLLGKDRRCVGGGGGNILLRNLFILVFINENIYSDGILTWERERDLSICLFV